jgi:hypothetical protein
MQTANAILRHYTGTDTYYQYHFGTLVTDGVKALAEEFNCFWLLDIIVSYQPSLKGEDFQVWKLDVKDDASATVICADGNDNVLQQQVIPYTDFTAREATIWVEGNVLLLPSEH